MEIQRISQGYGFGGTTSNPDATRPEITSDPIKITYDYEREKTGDWENHRIVPLFPLIFLPTVDEKKPPKKFPIQLGEPRVETSFTTIKLPAGWGADLPAAVHQKTSFANFDKTYKIEGDTLTIERKIQILTKDVPAANWKDYKKWCDASFSDGEPFISLISTETDKKTSTTSDSVNARSANLLRQAYEQIQRGEMNAAEQTLNQVQQIDPNSIWYYRALLPLQSMRGKQEEAADTMRHILKMKDVTEIEKKAAAQIFYSLGHYDEALPLLEAQIATEPENEKLQLELATSQMRTGAVTTGSKSLLPLLAKSSDENTINNAAYELALANVELGTAEKATRGVVDTLTTESNSWVVSASTKGQQMRQSLLVATWDTLGWILYREGRIEEGENYVRASWNNQQGGESGLHLGEIEEKLGHKAAAMGIYQIAMGTFPPETLVKPSVQMKEQKSKLEEHIAALKKQGIAPQVQNPPVALQKLMTMPLGPWKGRNSMVEYTFVLQQDKIGDLQQSDPEATAITGGNAMLRKATFNHWIPNGSEARLLLKGTLNCHGAVCELVVHRH
ncbi:tetratricopeptide repeat protein [Edaphobacter albus]|uniref:tetratricopeptide repeat protein n=1 Tax=Edaphobacter sp. 4G125 TaxID=2763071 RepID=UPI001645168A|nr:hypothetical protein [Edaphobacter sp. 4G125]QNI36850.1 hypothetical protein H7846_00440 [Edaphobacter sp. 4G125]